MESPQALGPFAAFMSSVTWSVGVSAYSRLSNRYAPSVVNTTRAAISFPVFLIAGILAFGATGLWDILVQTPAASVGWLALSMVASFAFGDFLFLVSTRHIGVPGALAIASAYPLWSAVAGWIFRGEMLSGFGILGLVLVVAGVALVVVSGRSQDAPNSTGPRSYWLGVSLAVVTSLFWALNTFATKQGGLGLPLILTNIYRMGFAALLAPMLGYVLVRQRPALVALPDLKRLWPIFLIESAGGTFCYMYGMTHAPLAVASALSSLSPAVIAPVAWLLKWERFSAAKFAGILAIVFGIVLLVG